MPRRYVLFLVLLFAVPLFAQEAPREPFQEGEMPEGAPIAEPVPPSYMDQRGIAMLHWYRSLVREEYPVVLAGAAPFEPRIYITGVRSPLEKPTVTSYRLGLYGPKDRTLVGAQVHTGHVARLGDPGTLETSVWTASFRYVPKEGLVRPETTSTYTFDFNTIKSESFLFLPGGVREPGYKPELRAADEPRCPSGQREEFFALAPPFRLDICVHTAARTETKSVGTTEYSIIVHYDRSWRWRSVVRQEGPRDDKKALSDTNPLVPIEVYAVTFTDADGKDVPHTLDYRAMWHWNETRTLYLSQHGIRELRWVGDLDAPVHAPEPAPAPTVAVQ